MVHGCRKITAGLCGLAALLAYEADANPGAIAVGSFEARRQRRLCGGGCSYSGGSDAGSTVMEILGNQWLSGDAWYSGGCCFCDGQQLMRYTHCSPGSCYALTCSASAKACAKGEQTTGCGQASAIAPTATTASSKAPSSSSASTSMPAESTEGEKPAPPTEPSRVEKAPEAPVSSNTTSEQVACVRWGFGSMMVPTDPTCKLQSAETCVKPPGFVGGDLRAFPGKTCEEGLEEVKKMMAEASTTMAAPTPAPTPPPTTTSMPAPAPTTSSTTTTTTTTRTTTTSSSTSTTTARPKMPPATTAMPTPAVSTSAPTTNAPGPMTPGAPQMPQNATGTTPGADQVACVRWGYGAGMKETAKTCSLESKKDCTLQPGFVGGNLTAYPGKTCEEALNEANKPTEATASQPNATVQSPKTPKGPKQPTPQSPKAPQQGPKQP